MCGLFGVVGPGIIQMDLDVFKELGIISQLRGMDGAGFYQIKSNAYKNGFDYEDLMKTDETFSELKMEVPYNKKKHPHALNSIAVNLIIGHVRAATKGDITPENSHPYMYPNIVGAHNGTLKDKKYDHKERTDSDLMFEDVSQRGLIPVLGELDKNSAYAITMYDRIGKMLYFGRNEKRTLHFALNEDRGVMYWSSESEFLKLILRRKGIKFRLFSLPSGFVWQCDPAYVPSAYFWEKNNKPFMKVVANFNPPVEEPRVEPQVEVKTEVVKVEDKPPFDTQKPTEKFSTGTVIQLPAPKRTSLRILHENCECGTKKFNLLEIDRCRKGKLVGYSYDKSTDTYYCSKCEKKEVKHVVH